MKKLFVFAVALTAVCNIYACSICGCGTGNLYLGLFPHFKKSFVGLRYTYKEYNTKMLNDATQFSNNFYNTTEIWGGYNISNRVQLMTFIPFHNNIQVDDDKKSTKSGLGDMVFLANYKLFEKKYFSDPHNPTSQSLWIGGGFKLPTGGFNIDPNDTTTTLADINAQLGTGSADFIVDAIYTYEAKGFGLTTSGSYKIALPNKQQYKYGNKFTVNAIMYHKINIGNVILSPNIGIGYENTAANTLNGSKIYLTEGLDSGSYHTGGYTVNALAGAETNIKNFSVGFNFQVPVKQEFAAGQTKMHYSAMVHCSIAL